MRTRAGVASAAALAFLLAACPNGEGPGGGGRREDRWLSAVDGLCGALTVAQDPEAAQAAFYDRSHDALHEIAAEVTPVDGAAAADLLEAKNVIEGDFRSGASPSALERDLQTLIAATIEALRALDIESPGCA